MACLQNTRQGRQLGPNTQKPSHEGSVMGVPLETASGGEEGGRRLVDCGWCGCCGDLGCCSMAQVGMRVWGQNSKTEPMELGYGHPNGNSSRGQWRKLVGW
jgi:hypothetical protein